MRVQAFPDKTGRTEQGSIRVEFEAEFFGFLLRGAAVVEKADVDLDGVFLANLRDLWEHLDISSDVHNTVLGMVLNVCEQEAARYTRAGKGAP